MVRGRVILDLCKTKRQNADPQDAITPANFARAFFNANP